MHDCCIMIEKVKMSEKNMSDNYRLISLIALVSKVFAIVCHKSCYLID